MKASSEMLLREIAGEHLLIPTGQAAQKIKGMLTFSESSVLLWKKLQTDCSEEELVDVLLAEYHIDRATAQQDIRSFLSQLRQLGILE